MEHMFSSGRIVDVVLAFMALEVIALVAYRRLQGRGLRNVEIASVLLPGLFLLLAFRAALLDAPWPPLAGYLLAALVAHLADLWRRHSRT